MVRLSLPHLNFHNSTNGVSYSDVSFLFMVDSSNISLLLLTRPAMYHRVGTNRRLRCPRNAPTRKLAAYSWKFANPKLSKWGFGHRQKQSRGAILAKGSNINLSRPVLAIQSATHTTVFVTSNPKPPPTHLRPSSPQCGILVYSKPRW